MLDLGWQEFMVIAVVTVLVVGPKEIPRVFRTVTGAMRKVRALAGEFHSAMDDMAREADLDDLKKEVTKIKDGSSDWVKDIDPTGEVQQSVEGVRHEIEATKSAARKPGTMKTDPPMTTFTPSPSATTPAPIIKEKPPKLKAGDPGLLPEARASVLKEGALSTPVATRDAERAPLKATAKKTTAKRAAAKKTTAKKATAKKAKAKKGPTPKTATPKAAPPKATIKKATTKKATAKKAQVAKPALKPESSAT